MMNETILSQKKRASALVTVNLDAEQFWLGMFPESERRPKTLSMGDYGINRGLDRVLKALEDYSVSATFFVPGMVAKNHQGAVEKILAGGHEVALHGHTHIPMHLLTIQQQKEEMLLGREILQKICGYGPMGFRAPEGELTEQTMRLIAETGFEYSSNLYDNDLPYRHAKTGLWEIPMNWNIHDFPYFAFNYSPAFPISQSRVSSYERVEENYLEEFEAYREGGLCYVAQFTPQSIGSPGKIDIMRNVLKAISQAEDVWSGTCAQLLQTE